MEESKQVSDELRSSEQLEPGQVANFPGSLVVNNLENPPKRYALPKDKARVADWALYFRDGWDDVGIWKSAVRIFKPLNISWIEDRLQFVEMIASCLLSYLSGLIDTTITNFQTKSVPAVAGISNIFLLTLFIMAIAPGSGGHINPLITFSTMLCGLTSFARAVLYLIGQTIGAGLAGGILRGVFGPERSIEFHGGGCFREPGTVTTGQALLLETVSSFALLILAFGVALDPRQQKLFGPLGGPLAVGCSLGLVSFAGAGLVPGYTGASMNPARCFAFAITRRDFTDQWIWWVGPFCGSWLIAITYFIAPPYHDGVVPSSDWWRLHEIRWTKFLIVISLDVTARGS